MPYDITATTQIVKSLDDYPRLTTWLNELARSPHSRITSKNLFSTRIADSDVSEAVHRAFQIVGKHSVECGYWFDDGEFDVTSDRVTCLRIAVAHGVVPKSVQTWCNDQHRTLNGLIFVTGE